MEISRLYIETFYYDKFCLKVTNQA